jgi:hypothetical protein
MEKIGFRIPLVLAVALYGYSLTLPVYGANTGAQGWLALVGGWITVRNDIPTWISWFANITFIWAVIIMLQRKNPKPFRALILGVTSIVLGLAVLGAGKTVASASETMAKSPMGFAFYAWIGSFILISLAAWIKFKKG